MAGIVSQGLAHLGGDLGLPDVAEVDAPLGVVVVGRHVVVARVDVADLLRVESTSGHVPLRLAFLILARLVRVSSTGSSATSPTVCPRWR